MLPLSEKELDDLVALERERGAPPLTNWDSLATRLRAEGLITTSRSPGERLAARPWMQAAAAVLIAFGGAAVGRYTASPTRTPPPDGSGTSTQTANGSNTPAQSATSQSTGGRSETAAAQGQNVSASATPAEFHSPEEAWATLNRAGEEYQRASSYLSASNTDVPMPTNPETYRTRLAALDNVMTEMRSALHEAPHDPVINQYYLATVGAREATLRQLGTTLPAGARLNRF
jgi:hypothetical protein